MSTVVNLFGAPGSGKSTLAAGLFWELKRAHVSVELVQEWVKGWAWEGREIGPFDQTYIAAKQARAEYRLFGKADVLITDAPVWATAFYEHYYFSTEMTRPMIEEFYRLALGRGVRHLNLYLPRVVPYDEKGRYQNEAEADVIGGKMQAWLEERGVELEFPPARMPRTSETIYSWALGRAKRELASRLAA